MDLFRSRFWRRPGKWQATVLLAVVALLLTGFGAPDTPHLPAEDAGVTAPKDHAAQGHAGDAGHAHTAGHCSTASCFAAPQLTPRTRSTWRWVGSEALPDDRPPASAVLDRDPPVPRDA